MLHISCVVRNSPHSENAVLVSVLIKLHVVVLNVVTVAVKSDDLVQPSRQTRHSDSDLSYTTLVAHTDV